MSAVNAIGEGSISGGISIMAAQVPSQPYTPTKLDASPIFIKVQWLAPLNGGSPILAYNVYSGGQLVATKDGSVTEALITNNITPGQIYQITVSATNAVGAGSLSPALAIMAATVPSAPTSVIMVSQSATQIKISW